MRALVLDPLRKFQVISGAVIGFAVVVAGCSTVQSFVQSPSLQAAETAAQQAAVAVCGYLPSVESVAAIILAGNPLLTLPEQIANAICAAVQPVASAGIGKSTPVTPTVAGVAITGKFVK